MSYQIIVGTHNDPISLHQFNEAVDDAPVLYQEVTTSQDRSDIAAVKDALKALGSRVRHTHAFGNASGHLLNGNDYRSGYGGMSVNVGGVDKEVVP